VLSEQPPVFLVLFGVAGSAFCIHELVQLYRTDAAGWDRKGPRRPRREFPKTYWTAVIVTAYGLILGLWILWKGLGAYGGFPGFWGWMLHAIANN
jgi:hypothetical protein